MNRLVYFPNPGIVQSYNDILSLFQYSHIHHSLLSVINETKISDSHTIQLNRIDCRFTVQSVGIYLNHMEHYGSLLRDVTLSKKRYEIILKIVGAHYTIIFGNIQFNFTNSMVS